MKTTMQKILDYFEEHEDIFNECIEELDSYNGYLGDDRYYHMEDLPELMSGVEPFDLLRMAYFGHDENYENSSFNPNREYFSFNGYGNLVSTDYKDYSNFLDHYFVDSLEENRNNIWTIDNEPELTTLFYQLQEEYNG